MHNPEEPVCLELPLLLDLVSKREPLLQFPLPEKLVIAAGPLLLPACEGLWNVLEA